MGSYSTTMNIGELKGWVLVAFLGLTLALEVVDVARSFRASPPAQPIGALACWESCAWGGGHIQAWSRSPSCGGRSPTLAASSPDPPPSSAPS